MLFSQPVVQLLEATNCRSLQSGKKTVVPTTALLIMVLVEVPGETSMLRLNLHLLSKLPDPLFTRPCNMTWTWSATWKPTHPQPSAGSSTRNPLSTTNITGYLNSLQLMNIQIQHYE